MSSHCSEQFTVYTLGYASDYRKFLQEYYTKHLQAAFRLDKVKPWAAPIPEASIHPEPGPPPDIQAYLLALVSDTHAVDPSAMHVPLLVQRRCAAVQRSIDVLRVFRTLHHALEESSSLVCVHSIDYMQCRRLLALFLERGSSCCVQNHVLYQGCLELKELGCPASSQYD